MRGRARPAGRLIPLGAGLSLPGTGRARTGPRALPATCKPICVAGCSQDTKRPRATPPLSLHGSVFKEDRLLLLGSGACT